MDIVLNCELLEFRGMHTLTDHVIRQYTGDIHLIQKYRVSGMKHEIPLGNIWLWKG